MLLEKQELIVKSPIVIIILVQLIVIIFYFGLTLKVGFGPIIMQYDKPMVIGLTTHDN